MISLYKEYLIDLLNEAGVKGNILRNLKELQLSKATHLGAVLFENEKFEVDGSKKIYVREDDVKVKRVKKLKRITQFNVVIGDAKEDVVEEVFSNFLSIIQAGIDDGKGNYVEIIIGDSDWVSDKDSVIQSKVAVQVVIEFIGGIYKDTEFRQVSVEVGLHD